MKEEPEIVKQLRKEEKNNQLDDFRFEKKPEFIKKIQRKRVIESLEEDFGNMFFFEVLEDDDCKSCEENNFEKNEITEKSVLTKDFKEEGDDTDIVDYLDDIDKAIIDLIQVNPRISPSNIAKILDLSRTAIFYRIYDLKNQGLIKKYNFRFKKK